MEVWLFDGSGRPLLREEDELPANKRNTPVAVRCGAAWIEGWRGGVWTVFFGICSEDVLLCVCV